MPNRTEAESGAWDMACRAEAVGGTGKPDHGEGGGMAWDQKA
ncbi:MAG: hypothetical protein R6V57_17015 [Vicinamibacterales bacterium]